ncbi:HK97 gp10 family phage protein [Pseudomonas kurunegalensis]|uniref:HK97 gp10 family phage protein n=1 Tax=Pseudomonas kurunegalensis TaxID=485880 RepID=UPI0021176D2F|nr:HK97 gp10 family phage protein [Pseudomonas kurunegalensis]
MANSTHHMTSRYGGLNGSFTERLSQFRDQTIEDMTEVFQRVMIEIGTTIIRLSPVDTGRFKGNWQLTVDAPATASLDNYDREGHDTIAKLVADVQHLSYGQTAYLVNNLIYAIPLEYGHSGKAPAGMVRITLAGFQQMVEQAVREVAA